MDWQWGLHRGWEESLQTSLQTIYHFKLVALAITQGSKFHQEEIWKPLNYTPIVLKSSEKERQKQTTSKQSLSQGFVCSM